MIAGTENKVINMLQVICDAGLAEKLHKDTMVAILKEDLTDMCNEGEFDHLTKKTKSDLATLMVDGLKDHKSHYPGMQSKSHKYI